MPSNHPFGHYFDVLLLTGFYYTFIGAARLIAAAVAHSKNSAYGSDLLLAHHPEHFVLTHATRFDETRIVTLMLLANLF